ncbi:MAG TPA: hypothetical protein VFD46_11865 [Chryseolinea sp.]|jgi:hypothetical protein|nr:hypothetical protein [Chryseolinea sp.]
MTQKNLTLKDSCDYYNDKHDNEKYNEYACVNTSAENVANEFTACHRYQKKQKK